MKLARCPSCRTVNDVTEEHGCRGCGRDLSGMVPARTRFSPVLLQVRRDQRAGRGFLLVLGILSAASLAGMLITFHVSPDGGCLMCIVAFWSVAIFLWFAMGRTIYFAKAHALLKLLGYLVTAVLGLFGAGILTVLTCNLVDRGTKWGG